MEARMAVNKSTLYKNESQKNYDITEAKREQYRKISHESRLAKRAAEQGLFNPVHAINKPRFCPNTLMPQLAGNGLNTVSLFCGGGGLDLGFDRAGYMQRASYELIPICGDTFRYNRPEWDVFVGPDHGDVTQVDWRTYQDEVERVNKKGTKTLATCGMSLAAPSTRLSQKHLWQRMFWVSKVRNSQILLNGTFMMD